MPLNLNRVTLIGRLGKDPVTKEIKTGGKVTAFSLATTYYWKVKDDWKERDTWHRVVCWHKLAEETESLKKGDAVYVEGKLETREYKDKAEVNRTITEVIADHVYLFVANKPKPKPVEGEGDDIPF